MSLKKGDIVLVPFPFTDLSTTKLRPAVVLWVDLSGIDITVCFISSQNINNLGAEEFLIETTHPEFSKTGLKMTSKVRVSRIVTIERNLITRKLGELNISLLQTLNNRLKNTFQL
ncbi:putative plasmid maintenance toxin/cell growth inhibitor [Crocosphaera subtropica ATCC 51142]|uniref:Plasmid maintenance toxin/cell growth inhibitor n=1 Tax=Crocosphaera subtropica (strain ATCC 51142 / BH68) TaxID=43989 RepID=B1X2I5_CROS5|nr:type II toxin-antitoxin system PemK/MazF family toxin [Crocosphaera subtropica]ACB54346.1 putative plasmid maintenance toxin/cell growth inhibitor [Crocosphaera subtropica ATCC 51142]